MALEEIYTGDMDELNLGAAGAVALLNPLAAQLDAVLALGLGPFKFDLAAQFDASIALQASLDIQLTLPSIGLEAALQAIADLQVALSAALSITGPQLELGLELGLQAALSASLSARLGLLDLLIEASLALKIPAIKAAAELSAALSAGPAVILTFGDKTLSQTGSEIQAKFNTEIGDPAKGTIEPSDIVHGIIIVTKDDEAAASLNILFLTS